jgi:hypothetical protein
MKACASANPIKSNTSNWRNSPPSDRPLPSGRSNAAVVRKGCDRSLGAYTLWDLDETAGSKLIDRLVEAKPKSASCPAGHEIEWQSGKIKATMLPF